MLELPPGLPDGTYVVAWRVVSTDSHPVSGAFTFSIGAPSQVLFDAGGSSDATVRTIDAFARGVAFFGLALALGGAVVVFALWPSDAAPRPARKLVWGGVGLLLAGSLVVLLMQGPYASGGSITDAFSTLSFSLGTRFGHALVARIVLALVFVVLLVRGLRIPAALCGVALIFTWTLVDHSRTGVQTWLGVPAASAHLLAMAIWFGGLLVVLAYARDAPVARFSRVAVVCWAVLAVSGVYLAYRQTGELGALPHTLFGRLLLVKTAVALGILALAYFSRRAVHARHGPTAQPWPARRSWAWRRSPSPRCSSTPNRPASPMWIRSTRRSAPPEGWRSSSRSIPPSRARTSRTSTSCSATGPCSRCLS